MCIIINACVCMLVLAFVENSLRLNLVGDCVFDGVVYENGTSFPAPDGCNTWYTTHYFSLYITQYMCCLASVQTAWLDAQRFSAHQVCT